jgi:hypothetical protein
VAVQWSAEYWQFFAFMFAVLLTLAFALLDQSPWPESRAARAVLRVTVFLVLGGATLFSRRCQAGLVRLLGMVKTTS